MIRVGRGLLRPAGRLAGPVSLYPPVLRRRVSQPRVQSMSEQLLYFLQQMFNGLTLGSTYALIAIGYTMVYGIIGMINFAHGEVCVAVAVRIPAGSGRPRPPPGSRRRG